MPTAARAGGFQERKVDDMPCWGRTTTLLPLFRMYNPKLPILALPRGCTSLAFIQAAQADVVVVEKLSDMDFVKSSNHMAPCRKTGRCIFCLINILISRSGIGTKD